MIVADVVVVERDDPAAVGAPPDPYARHAGLGGRGRVLAERENLQAGAVEEHLVEVGRAGADDVPDRELEGLGLRVGLAAAARLDGEPGSVVAGEDAFAHEMREGPDLGPGVGDDGRGLAGLLGPEPVPVADQPVEGPVEGAVDVEPAAAVVGGDRPGRLAVAEALGRLDLPGPHPRLLRVRKGVERVEDLLPLARGRDVGAHPGGFPVLAVDRDQDVLDVRLLAADGVDPDGAGDVADEAKPGPGLDRLLLLGVAREDHLGAGGSCHAQDIPGLERGKLAGLVDHDDGAGADRDPAVGDAGVELVDAPAGRVEIGAQLQGDAPRHRGGDNVVALRPVEVGDRPQRRRLPAPGRALDDGDLARLGGGFHGGDLLVVDGIVGRLERAHPGGDGVPGDREAVGL